MEPERWSQIERLYHAALELDKGEREGFLARACAGDESLRQEVESLLESDSQAGSFIESPAIEVAGPIYCCRRWPTRFFNSGA